MLFVTHDRMFGERVATDVILFACQSLRYFNLSLRSFEQAQVENQIKQHHQAEKLERRKALIGTQISRAQVKARAGG